MYCTTTLVLIGAASRSWSDLGPTELDFFYSCPNNIHPVHCHSRSLLVARESATFRQNWGSINSVSLLQLRRGCYADLENCAGDHITLELTLCVLAVAWALDSFSVRVGRGGACTTLIRQPELFSALLHTCRLEIVWIALVWRYRTLFKVRHNGVSLRTWNRLTTCKIREEVRIQV